MTKTALITGGSSGIGLEFARLLARENWKILIVSQPLAELKAAKAQLLKEFPELQVTTYQADLSIQGSAEKVYQYSKDQHLQVDLLVNNAGFGTYGFINNISVERESSMINLNVLCVYQLTRYFLDDMVKRDSGNIINVSSISAYQPNPGLSTYGATKAFVLSFSRAINFELKKKQSKVRVTAVCPTPVRTRFQQNAAMQKSKLFDSWLTVSAPTVAQAGMRAMHSGKDYVVPNHFFHIMNYFVRRLPSGFLMRYAAHELKEKKNT